MRKQILLLAFLIVPLIYLSAQNRLSSFLSEDEKAISESIKSPVSSAGRSLYIEAGREIEGSPFFKDEWMSADVIIDKIWYGNVNAKLSFFTGKVHVKIDSSTYTVNAMIEELWLYGPDSLNGERYIFRTGYFKDPELVNTCLQVLSDGKVQFLKFRKAFAEEYPVPFENPRVRFSFNNTYYIYGPSKELVKVKLTKDAIVAAVPEMYAEQLQKLIDDKKTKFKSEASVTELLDAFNKLLAK